MKMSLLSATCVNRQNICHISPARWMSLFTACCTAVTYSNCSALCTILYLCLSQAVLRGDRAGWLAIAAELLRPLSCSGCGHVAGAVGGRCSQPRWDPVWRLRLLHTCTCEAAMFSSRPAVCSVLLWRSGPGAELPGQVPFLPLPGWRAGRCSFAQRGGEEGEPRGAAGHPAPPLADWTWRPHEDDFEETVRALKQ